MPTMTNKAGDVRVVDDSLVELMKRDGYQVQKPAAKSEPAKDAKS
jgi:hypothetical protein